MAEVDGDVDVGGEAEAQQRGVLAVQQHRAVQHVQEQVQVGAAPREVRRHAIEQQANQLKCAHGKWPSDERRLLGYLLVFSTHWVKEKGPTV